MIAAETAPPPDDPPPILRSWRRMYALVLVALALVVALFTLLTRLYTPEAP